MPKKKKLNSKNPAYMDQSQKKEKIIKRKELACTTSNGVKIYKIWYV
jgi:hypothetical protein|tara:strand:- start:270 stop:410 length:141 start_codon:yes stop_codon:yes gene_type:complete